MVRCTAPLVGFMVLLAAAISSRSAQAADFGDVLVQRATDFSNELGVRLGDITGHVLDMRFDWRRLKAKVRLGGSESHFDCQGVVLDGSYVRINARVDLLLGPGNNLAIVFPTIDMAPQDMFGRRQIIVRLPLFERQF